MSAASPDGGRPRNLTRFVVRGATWIVTANISTLGLRVVFLAVLARLLSPIDFGLAAVGISFAAFANLFGDAGISNSLVQQRDLTDRHISTAFGYSLFLGAGLLLLTLASANLAENVFRMPGLAPVLRVMGVSFALQAMCVVPRALLKRALKYRALAISEFIAFNFGYGVTACTMAYAGFGVWSLVIGVTLSNAVAAVLYFLFSPHKLSVNFCLSAFRDLIGASSGFSVSAIANLVALQADNLIVGQQLGAKSLGLYSRAYQLMSIPATALGQVSSYIIFPMLARIQDDRARLQRVFIRGTSLCALIGIPTSILVPLYSSEIVQILFGPNWTSITSLLTILGFGIWFRLGYKVPGALLQSTGHIAVDAWIQISYAACVVVGALIAVNFGLDTLARVIVASVFLTFLIANVFTMRLFDIPALDAFKCLLVPVCLASGLGVANYVIRGFLRPRGDPWLTMIVAGATSIAILALAMSVPAIRRRFL